LVITIEDDGIGIDRSTVADNGGVGIANTRSRLSIMYGSNAALDVMPRPAGGTVCRLVVPIKHQMIR
jgi:sensor histidine kinase YesM